MFILKRFVFFFWRKQNLFIHLSQWIRLFLIRNGFKQDIPSKSQRRNKSFTEKGQKKKKKEVKPNQICPNRVEWFLQNKSIDLKSPSFICFCLGSPVKMTDYPGKGSVAYLMNRKKRAHTWSEGSPNTSLQGLWLRFGQRERAAGLRTRIWKSQPDPRQDEEGVNPPWGHSTLVS